MKFVYEPFGTRVVFGSGAIAELPSELDRLGIDRALLLSRRPELAGDWIAGVFDGAAMHVPVDVVQRALARAEDTKARALVAVGGGSTIGLAKALALETDLSIVAVPTTYSGSEMTPIWGVSREGTKTTGRDPRVLPKSVIYDPELTRTLPAAVSGPSGMNAIAHAVEALYAKDASPVVSLIAEDGIRALCRGLSDGSHTEALYGAFLAGAALGAVGMALHHKLCHVLGGSFGLPHAATHAVILPHAAAYNRDAAPEAMARIARALDADDAPAALFDLGAFLDVVASLEELGMSEDQLDRAVDIAMESAYENPRPVTRDDLRRLLDDAFHGRRPPS